MKMTLACPISFKQRDNNVARIVAVFVVIAALTANGLIAAAQPSVYLESRLTILPAVVLLLVLAADFAVRGFWHPKFSPLAIAGRGIHSGLGLKNDMTDAAPKVFAARIGLVFSLLAALLLVLGFSVAAQAVLVVLAICAFLEAAFSYCVGCKMYQILPVPVGLALSRGFVG